MEASNFVPAPYEDSRQLVDAVSDNQYMNWTRTAATTLVTGYTVVLTNETGMTTRQVKFGINDYLGARTSLKGTKWVLMLYHGTTCVDARDYSSEAAARSAARKWIKKKLSNLRGQYEQAERNVIADALARGYKIEEVSL